MEANEELKKNEQNEFEEIEEKDLKAVSGGCGSSTTEPASEPVVNPYDCPSGGVHTSNNVTSVVGDSIRSLCTKCGLIIVSDDEGAHWKTSQDACRC